VTGDDGALAAAVQAAPGALVRFVPDARSDIARAVGLRAGEHHETAGRALPMDAITVRADGVTPESLACNLCVVGAAPDRLRRTTAASHFDITVDGREWFSGRATTVVIATGQFLRGADLVPRGHPGDGRLEIHVYTTRRGERRAVRARLPTGDHVPHPRIRTGSAREVEVRATRPVRLEVDGTARGSASRLVLAVVPAAYRLLL
jgi:hypothetical protein